MGKNNKKVHSKTKSNNIKKNKINKSCKVKKDSWLKKLFNKKNKENKLSKKEKKKINKKILSELKDSDRYCSNCCVLITDDVIKCGNCKKSVDPDNSKFFNFFKEYNISYYQGKALDFTFDFISNHSYAMVLSLTVIVSTAFPILNEFILNKEIVEPSKFFDISLREVKEEKIEEEKVEEEKVEEVKEEDKKQDEEVQEVYQPKSNIYSSSEISNRVVSAINSGNMSLISSLYFSNYYPSEFSKYNTGDFGNGGRNFTDVYYLFSNKNLNIQVDTLVNPYNDPSYYTSSSEAYNLYRDGYAIQISDVYIRPASQSSNGSLLDIDYDLSSSSNHLLMIEKDGNWYIYKFINVSNVGNAFMG